MIFSIVPLIWSDNERDMQLSRLNATFSIGMIVGPLLSALIYNKLGYFLTFCTFAVACIIITLICAVFIPNSLNYDEQEEEN